MGNNALLAFAVFGLASQAVLLAYFAARRWRTATADRYGWTVYAGSAVGGVVVGIVLIATGASWRLSTGPLLLAAWALFGAWADLYRRTGWRSPIRWQVLAPYVVLYLAAQMFLWWPLWNTWSLGWALYLVLFVSNTALNMSTHVPAPAKPAAHAV